MYPHSDRDSSTLTFCSVCVCVWPWAPLKVGGGRGGLKVLFWASVSTIQLRALEQYSIWEGRRNRVTRGSSRTGQRSHLAPARPTDCHPTSFSKALNLWSKSRLSAKCLSTPSTLERKKKKGTNTSLVFLSKHTGIRLKAPEGGRAHLADIRLSLSESLLFCILFCAVRKSSF